ncbi:aminotransferase class V-fold PLP-dependent enzyme, partial [Candidatus Bathyarchaeota archaeon]
MATALDIESIRRDFPALEEWTYLDNSFVGLYPRQVREGYDEFLDRWMNFSAAGTRTILTEWLEKAERVRRMVADFIGASPREIAFTTCTGSGLNIVVNGTRWKRGDNVVFPENEHNPLDTTTLRRNGVESRAVEVNDGRIDLSDLEKAVDDHTRLVQVSQVSYINGFRFDLKDVADIAHEHGAKVLVDATQAIGALVTDVKKEDVDYLSAAPYKYLMGPAGLAFLYVRSEHIGDLEPDRVGWKNQLWEGDHAEEPLKDVHSAVKFEYGTLHFQGVYGLERSLEYLNDIGMDKVERRVLMLSEYLWSRLNEIGKRMYTLRGTRSPVVSFFERDAVEISA